MTGIQARHLRVGLVSERGSSDRSLGHRVLCPSHPADGSEASMFPINYERYLFFDVILLPSVIASAAAILAAVAYCDLKRHGMCAVWRRRCLWAFTIYSATAGLCVLSLTIDLWGVSHGLTGQNMAPWWRIVGRMVQRAAGVSTLLSVCVTLWFTVLAWCASPAKIHSRNEGEANPKK